MSIRSSLRHSRQIARVEWTRHRRERGRHRTRRHVLLVALFVVTVAAGSASHSLGGDLASGQPIPFDWLLAIAAVGFGAIVWRSSSLTHGRFEQLNPDVLLTAVPARVPALGLLWFVIARVALFLAVPTIGVAVGLAIGLRSPPVALTIVTAVAGVAALAVAVGVAGRLAARLVGLRLARGDFYRDLLVVFGWVPVVVAAFVLQDASVSVTGLSARLESQPLAGLVDLAFLGAGERVAVEASHAVGALGVCVLVVAASTGAIVTLVRRLWEADPVGSTGARGSHSFVDEGWLDRLLGDRVSRPVRTVARKRWLVERRVPRGLLYTGYVLCFVGVVVFPTFSLAGVPGLILVVFALGLATGVVFGVDPIGTEYRALPMLFTTVSGGQFVHGALLAALAVCVPLVSAVVLPLGVVSDAGPVETIALVLVGVALCACTVTVGLAIGLTVDRSEFVPVPGFFTDVRVYGEIGSAPFLRLGKLFAIVTLVGVPAALGNVPPVYEGALALGIPADAVRVGSLVLTSLVAAGVSRIACRIAVDRYRTYQIR